MKSTLARVSLKVDGQSTDSQTTTLLSLGFTNKCLKKTKILRLSDHFFKFKVKLFQVFQSHIHLQLERVQYQVAISISIILQAMLQL